MLTQDAVPPLGPGERERAAALAALIHARIAGLGGWLPFAGFMQAALYEPELGYYMAGGALFGAEGDFVTAPELSPLFANCLANLVGPPLAETDGGILEFGAGSGRLAAELVAALARRGRAPRRYRIVEPSPQLRERQRRLLERAPAGATSFEWLPEPPRDAWAGVAIANEVVDALPVDRFRITPGGGCEALGVAADGGAFRWQARAADARLRAAVAGLQRALPAPMPPGYVSELRPGQDAWLLDAASSLTRGLLLVVDYGLPRAHYYHPSRDGGTLAAFRRHRRVEDLLAAPGCQDLTAWVDFSALADAARAAGLDLAGFATQAHFLLEAGIEPELARLVEAAPERDRAAHRQATATLLLPGEMGERFKLMALTRGIRAPLHGFGFRDLGASL